ncbi:AraC family transcriptional regulator [Flammeovirga sp. EKP202]|uniref:helix-turn-helix domain-containing protein n=1 Tax=Flammeovirga sp. EKP202 TaxID=2770592 RepID=UPI00165F95F8|nr:AraC family transcriptional regulator [Flammeovirga sp. EKP202]MBD0400790.1 helix-turn-helix transcriptional regulator [Flammeovirga sp. EKP202]
MIHLLSILTLIGAANGLFLSAYLYMHKKLSLLGRLLVHTTSIWSFIALIFSLMHINPFQNYIILSSIGSSATTFLYPLLYLFLKYGWSEEIKFNIKDVRHFITPVVFFCLSLPIIYWDSVFRVTGQHIELIEYVMLVNQSQDIINVLLGYGYLIYFLIQMKEKDELNTLALPPTHRQIFYKLTYAYLGVHTIGVIGIVGNYAGFGKFVIYAFDIYYIAFIITLYYIFHWVISNKLTVLNPSSKAMILKKQKDTTAQVQEDIDLIIQYVESSKAYLRNDFTLVALAKETYLNRSRVSIAINEGLDMNFNEFISDYRIKEAQRIMKTEEGAQIKLEVLAKEAGFNSKTTFNRSFKEKTGVTPSQYKENIFQ